VPRKWESAIAGLAGDSSRSRLTVAYARYLLQRSHTEAGIRLLATILTAFELPRPVELEARALLREHWRQDPPTVKTAWSAVTEAAMPEWVQLTDDDIRVVIDWINTTTWAESRDYLNEHTDRMTAATTDSVLDEIALKAPTEVIEQHRALLAAARSQGADAAYRRFLLTDTLREWLVTPDWQSSRAFLLSHTGLLDQDVPSLLADFGGGTLDPSIAIHHALLTLAVGQAGPEDAYRCLADQSQLDASLSQALAARDTGRLQALATLEAAVHGQTFLGTIHAAAAQLLNDPTAKLPEEYVGQLARLVAQADPTDRNHVSAQLTALVASTPANDAVAQLQRLVAPSTDS
jgi:hypothetical protein